MYCSITFRINIYKKKGSKDTYLLFLRVELACKIKLTTWSMWIFQRRLFDWHEIVHMLPKIINYYNFMSRRNRRGLEITSNLFVFDRFGTNKQYHVLYHSLEARYRIPVDPSSFMKTFFNLHKLACRLKRYSCYFLLT